MNRLSLLDTMKNNGISVSLVQHFDQRVIEDNLGALIKYKSLHLCKQLLWNPWLIEYCNDEEFSDDDFMKMNTLFSEINRPIMHLEKDEFKDLVTSISLRDRGNAILFLCDEESRSIYKQIKRYLYYLDVSVDDVLILLKHKSVVNYVGKYYSGDIFDGSIEGNLSFIDDTDGCCPLSFCGKIDTSIFKAIRNKELAVTLLKKGIDFDRIAGCIDECNGIDEAVASVYGIDADTAGRVPIKFIQRLDSIGKLDFLERIKDAEFSKSALLFDEDFFNVYDWDSDYLDPALFESLRVPKTYGKVLKDDEVGIFANSSNFINRLRVEGVDTTELEECRIDCDSNPYVILKLIKRPFSEWKNHYGVKDNQLCFDMLCKKYVWDDLAIKYSRLIIDNCVTRPLLEGGILKIAQNTIMFELSLDAECMTERCLEVIQALDGHYRVPSDVRHSFSERVKDYCLGGSGKLELRYCIGRDCEELNEACEEYRLNFASSLTELWDLCGEEMYNYLDDDVLVNEDSVFRIVETGNGGLGLLRIVGNGGVPGVGLEEVNEDQVVRRLRL